MQNFIYGSGKPSKIIYNGQAVQKVVYGNTTVWTADDSYVITGTLYGQGVNGYVDVECVNCPSSTEYDRQYYTDYSYKLSLTFSGVTKFPIKYISKSGATVSLEKSSVSGSGTTYTYNYNTYLNNDSGTSDESFDVNEGIKALKSIYPASGVDGYSSISSINISTKDEGVTNCDVS